MQRIVICDNCSGTGIGIGAVMQNVAVAVVDPDRGIRRTATTDYAGQYRFTSLPPVAYDISVAMPGFESQIQKRLRRF
jgi:hypothetical protein